MSYVVQSKLNHETVPDDASNHKWRDESASLVKYDSEKRVNRKPRHDGIYDAPGKSIDQ